MTDIVNLLREKIDTKDILINEPMSKHTSFKTGGNADIFIKAHSVQDIQFILKIARENNIDVFIFGNGSNLIVKDKGIRGITIKIELKNISIQKRRKGSYCYSKCRKQTCRSCKKIKRRRNSWF